MIKNILIGADPELFIEKNGTIVSAIGTINAGKHNPKFITEEGHAIQEDNVMVEFNIPPSGTKKEFLNNINYVKDYLTTYYNIKGFKLNYSASAELDPGELNSPEAKVFGCEPDYNVYEKCINKSPKKNGTLRSCGGHIHIGYDNPDQETSELLVKALDITLGLDSVLLDPDTKRRSMYGKAGCFRFKPYGLEYRTLSNFWIKTDSLINWTYDRVHKAIDLVNTGKINIILERYEDDIKFAIDTNNIESVIELTSKIELIETKEKVK